MVAGALLILGAIGWYLVVIAGQPAPASPPDSQSPQGIEDNYPQIERISPEDANTANNQNQAVFVDVRSSEEFSQGHIPGAVNIPLLDLPVRVDELSPDDWIITY
jgi:3-mercaptopyruvate sulfurtransferase SseA